MTASDQYLRDWAPQINTAPHANEMPAGLQSYSLEAFDDPVLVSTPFADVNGIPTTKPPQARRVRAPPAHFRPRKISHLLRPAAICTLLIGIAAIVTDLVSLQRDPSYVRQAKLVVLKNEDAFFPDAQGVLWDLRNPKFDGEGAYFVPVSEDEPLGSHVAREPVSYTHLRAHET